MIPTNDKAPKKFHDDKNIDGFVASSEITEISSIPGKEEFKDYKLDLTGPFPADMNNSVKSYKDYRCEYCSDSSFGTKQHLNRHIKSVHEKQKDYICTSCGKSFSQAPHLKTHIHTVHEGNRDYKCIPCEKSFSQAYNLRKHIDKNHEGQKYYKCDSCGESFSQAGDLKKHNNTIHQGKKDYKCKTCAKSFSTSQNLKVHIYAIHNGCKDYKCESCGKTFSRASNLKTHIHTVHHGHRDYKCDTCDRSFSAFSNLKKHIHAVCKGNQDYKCKFCDKSFTDLRGLKRHSKRHDLHKDYHCYICGKSYSTATNLKNHIHTIHEGHKDYKCDSCSNTFSQRGKLKRHIQKIHENMKEFKTSNSTTKNIKLKCINSGKKSTVRKTNIVQKEGEKNSEGNNVLTNENQKHILKDGEFPFHQIQNEDILNFFQKNSQSKKLLKFFKMIISGQIFSQRHFLLLKEAATDFETNSEIMKSQNITFLKDDGVIDDLLYEIGIKIFDEISFKFDFDTSESNFKSNYTEYVIIPEGIIYYLMDTFTLNYKIAEEVYVTTTAALT